MIRLTHVATLPFFINILVLYKCYRVLNSRSKSIERLKTLLISSLAHWMGKSCRSFHSTRLCLTINGRPFRHRQDLAFLVRISGDLRFQQSLKGKNKQISLSKAIKLKPLFTKSSVSLSTANLNCSEPGSPVPSATFSKNLGSFLCAVLD